MGWEQQKNTHLYRLLRYVMMGRGERRELCHWADRSRVWHIRPEFVQQYDKPLCADAFSGFMDVDNCKEDHQEVSDSTHD